MLNFENLDKAVFEGFGTYQIPRIPPVQNIPTADFIPFNYAKTCKEPEKFGVHFFIDDYQFIRLWNSPTVYLDLLRKFKCVLAPDFSTYTDMPVAMQIYNHYRKHWIARYLVENEITVIPTISWSDKGSFTWCLDGEPRFSVVAISNVGCMRDPQSRELFLRGFYRMKRQLRPSAVMCYGSEMRDTINIKPFYKKIEERAGK